MLSGVGREGLGFGVGEWQTIGAAALFTGQILCLERGGYSQNQMRNVATVMFAVKALVFLPVVLLGAAGSRTVQPWIAALGEVVAIYTNPAMLGMMLVLTLFSTVYGYATMVCWQGRVSATQAGLIYATEPIFATVWALFLPEWFSFLAGISYRNEVLTPAFLGGALLIVAANALLIFRK